jgi:hypothetical protein
VTVNETASSAGLGAGRHTSDTGSWAAPPDDLVTRMLCAATYLKNDFADQVAGALANPGRKALSPVWQVDAVQLARHAAQAGGLVRNRDIWLARTFYYLMGTGVFTLFLLFLGILNLVQAIVVWIVLWVWAYAMSVAIVFNHYRTARQAAIDVVYDPDAARPAPLGSVSTEEALVDLNKSNAVLFRAESPPFVGSGVLLDHWHLTLDVGKKVPASAPPATGAPVAFPGPAPSPYAPVAPTPAAQDVITGADLQEALLEMMPAKISPRPSAGNRLYVRGGSNALSVDLFRSGPTEPGLADELNFRRPVSTVPEPQIQRYLNQQDEAARVFTFFQHSSWGGQVVVTLFFRAFVSNQTLFGEGLVYALRPLKQEFYEVRALPVGQNVEVPVLFRAALNDAMELFLDAPGVLRRARKSPKIKLEAAQELEAEIVQRRDIDFGAGPSLREKVMNPDLEDHFAAVDEEMYYQIFNRRAMECIGTFLESKGIDLAEFGAQRTAIIDNTTANARKIYGSGSSAS